MASNQAAWLDGVGKQLRVGSAAMPTAGKNEIVIRNHSVAVNPADYKHQDGVVILKQFPGILGFDVAGEVVDVGPDVRRFQKGDRVLARLLTIIEPDPRFGGFQLYSVASASTTTTLPDSFKFIEGAVLPAAFDTALVGLCGDPGSGMGLPLPTLNAKPSGKTIVVWGGSSSVGALTMQLAVNLGAKVIATASSRNFDLCKKCGASEVFDHKSDTIVDDVVDSIKRLGGEFVGVYDTISIPDQTYKPILSILDQMGGGQLVITTFQPPKLPDNVKLAQVFGAGPITHSFYENYITPALESGQLKCLPEPLVVGHGLESVQKGLDTSRNGVSAKKVVIEL